MANRFKGLDVVDRGPEEQWSEVHNTVPKPSKEKEKQEEKEAVWLDFINSWGKKRREVKGKR